MKSPRAACRAGVGRGLIRLDKASLSVRRSSPRIGSVPPIAKKCRDGSRVGSLIYFLTG